MSTTDRTGTTTVLRAEGFACPSCVTAIEKHVGRLDGVHRVSVQFASGRVEVEHDLAVRVEDLVAAVGRAGYVARPSGF
jgi:copper chaperone CopZ